MSQRTKVNRIFGVHTRRACAAFTREKMDWARSGATTVELIVATAVLAVAVGGVGRLAATVNAGLRDREMSVRLGWEITNARETIGSWPIGKITEEEIEAWPVSEPISGRLGDARWAATVTSVEEPIAALQVRLELVGTYQFQLATPEQLVFWVPIEPVGAAESAPVDSEQEDSDAE